MPNSAAIALTAVLPEAYHFNEKLDSNLRYGSRPEKISPATREGCGRRASKWAVTCSRPIATGIAPKSVAPNLQSGLRYAYIGVPWKKVKKCRQSTPEHPNRPAAASRSTEYLTPQPTYWLKGVSPASR